MDRIFSLFRERKEEVYLATAGVFFVCFLIFLLNFPIVDKKTDFIEKGNEDLVALKIDNLTKKLNENIEAKSFYVLDIFTGQTIFAKNENEKLPLASLTKIMASLVISEKLPSFTSVPITRESISLQGDSGLYLNEEWKLKDLMDFTLITSSNDGIFALSSVLNAYESLDMTNTVELMNRRAGELGLKNTEFFNETGLDLSEGGSGGYGSAKDTATLIAYILNNSPEILSATAYPETVISSENDIAHTAKNTNLLSEKIPSLLASKTGFTDSAGGNLAVAFEVGPSKPIVAIVMGSSIEGRFSDMEKVVSATFSFYSDL